MPPLLAIIPWSRSTSRGRRRSRGRAKKPLIQARSVLLAQATARSSRPPVRAPDVAITALGHGLPAEPAIFARKLDLGDLLDLGLAVHEVAAVDRDRHGAAMVGRGPGRGQADAFQALRHPVLFGVHALLDVLAVDSAVGLRPQIGRAHV